MKNPLIVIGILLYMSGIFLPWGPTGSALETGFNEEGSPGLLGMLISVLTLVFAFRTGKKSYYIVIFISVLALLLPMTVWSKIMESPNGISEVKYGVYIMLISAIITILGGVKGLKKFKTSQSEA
jgi:hypothetical protein